MRFCGSCGSMSASGGAACPACGAPGSSTVEVPPSQAHLWARVESAFRCRECGQLTPVNGVLLDAVATCVHCGSTQALDVDVWDEALAHAHAAADVGRPGAAAALDLRGTALEPFARGEIRASFEAAGVTMDRGVMRTRSFVLIAGPGHPVAAAGGGALDVRIDGSGRLLSHDTRTGATSAFTLPAFARERCPSLVAVVAPDQRVGDSDAHVETAGAVATLTCPTCAAALDVEPGQHFVRCSYCSTACRIPSRTVRQLEGAAARSEAYFLCFEGPSQVRRALDERARFEAFARAEAERRAMEQREALGEIERADEIPRSSNARTLASGLVIALVALVGLVGYRSRIGAALGLDVAPPSLGLAAPSVSPEAGTVVPVAGAQAWDPTQVAAPRGELLVGCGCADPSGPLFELWLESRSPSGKPGGSPFVAHIDGRLEAPLVAPTPSAPPMRLPGAPLELEVRCAAEAVVYGDGSQATAWSRRDGSLIWSVPLGRSTTAIGADGREPRVHCESAVVMGESVELRVVGGRRRSLRLADGR